jgi:hypothetical protein
MSQAPAATPGNFFLSRWRGQVPLRRLFWRDMLLVGSVLNLLATFVALMLAAQGAGAGIAALVHFSPLPYNLFLYAALQRAPQRRQGHLVAGLAWLVVMTVA